jgi:nitrogen fixation protein NifU and related proteins
MSLRELYQEIIIDHGKSPRHVGCLSNATHTKAGHNPLCGDKLTLYIIQQDGVAQELKFEGTGCAISMASASLMIETVKGKSVVEIERLFTDFHHLLVHGKEPESDIGKLAVFSGVAEFPIRVKCATLAWHTLKAALNHDPNPTSTENQP